METKSNLIKPVYESDFYTLDDGEDSESECWEEDPDDFVSGKSNKTEEIQKRIADEKAKKLNFMNISSRTLQKIVKMTTSAIQKKLPGPKKNKYLDLSKRSVVVDLTRRIKKYQDDAKIIYYPKEFQAINGGPKIDLSRSPDSDSDNDPPILNHNRSEIDLSRSPDSDSDNDNYDHNQSIVDDNRPQIDLSSSLTSHSNNDNHGRNRSIVNNNSVKSGLEMMRNEYENGKEIYRNRRGVSKKSTQILTRSYPIISGDDNHLTIIIDKSFTYVIPPTLKSLTVTCSGSAKVSLNLIGIENLEYLDVDVPDFDGYNMIECKNLKIFKNKTTIDLSKLPNANKLVEVKADKIILSDKYYFPNLTIVRGRLLKIVDREKFRFGRKTSQIRGRFVGSWANESMFSNARNIVYFECSGNFIIKDPSPFKIATKFSYNGPVDYPIFKRMDSLENVTIWNEYIYGHIFKKDQKILNLTLVRCYLGNGRWYRGMEWLPRLSIHLRNSSELKDIQIPDFCKNVRIFARGPSEHLKYVKNNISYTMKDEKFKNTAIYARSQWL